MLHDCGEVACPDREEIVVEIVIGVVHRRAAPVGAALAEEEVGAGRTLQHKREILAGEQRFALTHHLVLSDHQGGGRGGDVGFLRRVNRRGVAALVGDLGRAALRGGGVVHRAVEELLDPVLHVGASGCGRSRAALPSPE